MHCKYNRLLKKVNDHVDEGDQDDMVYLNFQNGADRSFPEHCKESNWSERGKFPSCEWLQNKKQKE